MKLLRHTPLSLGVTMAQHVWDWRGTPPRCPLCLLPFRATDAVDIFGDRGWAHAYCVEEVGGDA